VSGLTNGTPTFFAVEAVNAFGVDRSLEAYAIPHPSLSAPSGVAASAASGRIALSWAPVASARGYRVGRAPSGTSTPTDIVIAETTLDTVTDVNVPNGQNFNYFVTALDDAEFVGPTSSLTASARGAALFVRAATPSAGDIVLRARLIALGFDVTEKSDTQVVTSDTAGKDLVVVTETVTSGNVDGKFTNVTVPVLSTEPSLFDDLRMTGLSLGNDFGTTPGQTQVNFVDFTHPMAARLSGIRTVNTAAGTYAWGIPGSEALVIGRLTSSSTRATIFGYQPGTTMVGATAPGRRVGLFLDSHTAETFTADGRTLFDAAARWAAGLR
jgi:hypothetical protein